MISRAFQVVNGAEQMERVMTKNDWVWLAIRVLGLLLLVMAISSLPEAFAFVYLDYIWSAALAEPDLKSMADWDAGAKLLKQVLATRDSLSIYGMASCIEVVVYSCAAFYFIKKGDKLHRIVSSGIAIRDANGEQA